MSVFSNILTKKTIAIFFVMAIFLYSQNKARAATTGEILPTLGTTVSEAPWSNNNWNTPTNIYSDDGATANVVAPTYDSPDQTFVLKATGFNFSAIPDGSTINGVIARINAFYRSGQGSGSMDLCQILDVSRSKVGTNKCSSAVALTTNTSTIITQGGSLDTWGNVLTTAWAKDPDFGIALGVLATAQNADVDIDYVTLEIIYTPPTTATLSASPVTCTISSGTSTCDIPFTWNITNATSPNLYNATTANTYSASASGNNVSYPITNGTNVVQARDNTSVLAGISVTGSCATGTVWNGSICALSPVTFTITSSAEPNGSIVPSGITSVAEGSSQLYTLIPDSGYDVETLVVDSISIATSTSYTFTNVQEPHTITATFVLIPPPLGSFSIVATAGANGTIVPSGATTITQGGSQAYTITPSSGYYIGTLTVDGGSISTSTSYTFTNVQTNHTIDATFIPFPTGTVEPAPDTGASRPTTITFLGKAFPKGTIQIIDKTLSDEKLFDQKNIIADDGSFRISFVGIFQTLHSFGLIAKDAMGRPSQTKFFTIDTRSEDFVIKDILVPPTIDMVSGQVSRGGDALIVGYASPLHIVQIKLDDIIRDKIIAGKDGSYSFKLPTGELSFGQHKVQGAQIDPVSKKESDVSISRTFVVSRLSVVKADLSGDGKIDIRDWSIFLSRWISKDRLLKESIDLNGDGKTNVADFSIFIRTIRK